jgi:hypothetical protein
MTETLSYIHVKGVSEELFHLFHLSSFYGL